MLDGPHKGLGRPGLLRGAARGRMIRFLRSDLAPPAGNNWGGFANPDYDALIGRILAEFDPGAQDRLVAELRARIVDDALFLLVAHDPNPRAMHRRVQGFVQARSWFQDLTPVRVTG